MRHVRMLSGSCLRYTLQALLLAALPVIVTEVLAAQGRTSLWAGYSAQWFRDRSGYGFDGPALGLAVRVAPMIEFQTAFHSAKGKHDFEMMKFTSLGVGFAVGKFTGRVEGGVGLGLAGAIRNGGAESDGAGLLTYGMLFGRWWPSRHFGLQGEFMVRSLGGEHGMWNKVLSLGVTLRP